MTIKITGVGDEHRNLFQEFLAKSEPARCRKRVACGPLPGKLLTGGPLI